jgi:uncharacterized protein (DUF885 family)
MQTDAAVRELTDQAWERVLDRDPVTASRCRSGPVEALPRGGQAAMEHDVSVAAGALAQLAQVGGSQVGGSQAGGSQAGGVQAGGVQAAFLRDHLEQEVAEAERFWYRFPVTPYNSFPLSDYRSHIFAAAEFGDGCDADRYLKLLDDYAALVEQLGDTMAEQRRRGIRLPAWAVPQCVATVRGHADASPELVVAPDRAARLGPGPAGRLGDGVDRVAGGRLAAAYQRLLDDLAEDTREGGDVTGLGQQPGGTRCYTGLIRLHTGLDLTADEVHAIGVAEVERITARIRDELDVTDEADYRRRLRAEPGMYARSPAELERLFQGHIERLEPLLQAASVIYHEGLPGHHLQIGLQAENTALHPIRREATELRTFALNGYLEGWAEYAAAFCDEIGMYATAADKYGRLSSERFHAARLVIDTGLNVLGWPRERGAAYLRANGFLSDLEIGTELLRYAVDDPGQALAYHLGHWYLRELRGARDPRQFHQDVLAEGPLPLAILGRQLNSPQNMTGSA